VRPLPFRGDLWPPAILALARLLRRERPGALLLHDPHAVSAGLVASRLAGRAALVAVRRVDFPLRGPFSRAKYAACDRVIVVSRAIGSVAEAGGVQRERLRLVYEGSRPRRGGGGREALAALGVPAGVPVIGNVAALTGHKDHATLVEAMALLRKHLPEARLVIAGEGELRSALEAQVRDRGLGDRVVFAGFRYDLDRLLPAFSAFCLSSRLEGLGTSLLDAMAFGLPVVATAAAGSPRRSRTARPAAWCRRATPAPWPKRSPSSSGTRSADARTGPRADGASSSALLPTTWSTRRCGSWRRWREGPGDPEPPRRRRAQRTREAVERGRPSWTDYAVYLTREAGHATALGARR